VLFPDHQHSEKEENVIRPGLESHSAARHNFAMKKSDVTCPKCHAGYRRIELTSRPGAKGEYHCVLCDELIEVLDGSTDVAIRLTVQPEKTFEADSKAH
jgi:protein-arginine kinase activator protein McsA